MLKRKAGDRYEDDLTNRRMSYDEILDKIQHIPYSKLGYFDMRRLKAARKWKNEQRKLVEPDIPSKVLVPLDQEPLPSLAVPAKGCDTTTPEEDEEYREDARNEVKELTYPQLQAVLIHLGYTGLNKGWSKEQLRKTLVNLITERSMETVYRIVDIMEADLPIMAGMFYDANVERTCETFLKQIRRTRFNDIMMLTHALGGKLKRTNKGKTIFAFKRWFDGKLDDVPSFDKEKDLPTLFEILHSIMCCYMISYPLYGEGNCLNAVGLSPSHEDISNNRLIVETFNVKVTGDMLEKLGLSDEYRVVIKVGPQPKDPLIPWKSLKAIEDLRRVKKMDIPLLYPKNCNIYVGNQPVRINVEVQQRGMSIEIPGDLTGMLQTGDNVVRVEMNVPEETHKYGVFITIDIVQVKSVSEMLATLPGNQCDVAPRSIKSTCCRHLLSPKRLEMFRKSQFIICSDERCKQIWPFTSISLTTDGPPEQVLTGSVLPNPATRPTPLSPKSP
jgi:hypothetical protein